MTFSAAEIAAHIAAAEASFNDVCTHKPVDPGSGSYGADTWPVEGWVEDVPCGFAYKQVRDISTSQQRTIYGEAVLRVSLTLDVDDRDRFTVRGNDWQVDGIAIGTTVKIVELKKVEAESGYS